MRFMKKNVSLVLQQFLWREWQRRGVFAWILRPLSWIFGIVMTTRRASFAAGWRRTFQSAQPVIMVGNLTVGGTGKTPVVIALIHALRDRGFTPGVISRGYGAHIKMPRAATLNADANEVGDEPLLIAQRTKAPVWVCPDRAAAARALCRAHPDIDLIISDDGLQHYRLARGVELVVFDERLGGNGWLLPAGPLREPLTRPHDATLIHTQHARPPWPNTFAFQLSFSDAWQISHPNRRRPLAEFIGEYILAAAGISAPERFFSMLRRIGLTLETQALPDHFSWHCNPFVGANADIILVTEKDAVKCRAWRDARFWAVPVQTTLDPHLLTLIMEKIRG